MPAGWEFISAVRINRIMTALQDIRTIPQELKWLRRCTLVPAVDGELMGRFIGQVLISDIIQDDAKAVTYSAGRLQLERTTAPNIKHGVHMTQAMLNELRALQQGGGNADIFDDYLNRSMDAILLGIRQRMEALLIAMHLDSLSYDRLGIKMSGVTWGMPSSFKVTVSTGWDTAGSATPINDMFALQLAAAQRYGKIFNRVTMSRQAFQYMIATTEFQNRVKLILNPAMSVTALPYEDIEAMRQLAMKLLGWEIEFYDARYWQQTESGSILGYAFHPINKVILSFTGDDNNAAAYDFSQGIVTESVVASIANTGMIGAFSGPVYGPVGYATAPPDLNPPNITQWGVYRGFPRKYDRLATAVLTVGSFTDSIPLAPLEF